MNDALKKELEEARKSNIYTLSRIEEIVELIYPNVERCDCEGSCSCVYPEGWVKLQDLKYHCYGTDIGIDDVLSKIED